MTTATVEKTSIAPSTSPASSAAHLHSSPPPRSAAKTLLVGFDLGTNKCCVLAGPPGSTDITVSKIVPSLVGYARDGLVDGIIAGNQTTLFGDDALRYLLHVRPVSPLGRGVIVDRAAARDLLRHVRTLIDPTGQAEIRAVIGVPANAEVGGRDDIRACATGVFDRVLLIPEPFLAALGYRDDARLAQPGYVDPVQNSLFIDIGGGTTDLCLVQGYFPTREDQLSLPFAGDSIDDLIQADLDRVFPNNGLSRHRIRELKEQHAYVGPIRKPLDVRVVLGGKAHDLELGEIIGRACNTLLDQFYPALTSLIARAPGDSVVTLLQNVIITGGGSQIRAIDTVLQQRLAADGYESPKVRLAGQDYKRYVALGALKAARAARENQWQYLLA